MQRLWGLSGPIQRRIGSTSPVLNPNGLMATKLDKTIKRELDIDGQAYTVTVSPEGVKLTQKGFRKGSEVSWRQLLASAGSGDSGDSGSTSGGPGFGGMGSPS
jgi:hypothetical protein